jgi:hypothetical protein
MTTTQSFPNINFQPFSNLNWSHNPPKSSTNEALLLGAKERSKEQLQPETGVIALGRAL